MQLCMMIRTFDFTRCIDWPAVMVILPSCRLLEVQKAENGNKWPETIAVVLWGTDNIKTYGESLAQVRWGLKFQKNPPGDVATLNPDVCAVASTSWYM